MQIITDERVPIKIWSNDPEESAVLQLRNVAKLPFIFHHVAAMPDVHWGAGSTVGSVIATKGAVIPAAVGVDIGCGMMAWDTGLSAADLKPKASELRAAIEKAIPVGFAVRQHPVDEGQGTLLPDWCSGLDANGKDWHRAKVRSQLGTLGGGNHFIELCEDERGIAWVTLHSGSRNIGKTTADFYMKRAKELCEMWGTVLPDKDLAFFPEGTAEYAAYLKDLNWCQDYAHRNRALMMDFVGSVLGLKVEGATNVHHNYATMEHHFGENVLVTRKGAVRAKAGDIGIIPGSMGAKSYIVNGLGNPMSFNSCSHGAGRKMGRKEAKRTFTLADLEAQTQGVNCRKDEGVLDELPSAYKDIDTVMENQKDLVEVLHTLKQFICIKG